MPRVICHLALIVAVGSVSLFPYLGATRLWDRDEPRNAGCAREMLERGDWVVPTFNGELRVLKPVLGYWGVMTAYEVFGVNEFAARFWSAVFAVGSALVTYFLGRRLFNDRVGLWSALILSSCLLWGFSGQLVTVDAHLMFFTTLALYFFCRGVLPPAGSGDDEGRAARPLALARDFPAWPGTFLLYAALGLAVLAKGLVGLIPPLAVIGLFLLIVRLSPAAEGERRGWLGWLLQSFAPGHVLRTCLSMRLLAGILVILAVAGPWYVWVGVLTDGEFPRGFFLEHHFGRAARAMEGHGGPFLLYYLATIAVGFFPWSIFLIPMGVNLARRLRAGDAWSAGYLFTACWVGAYVFIFSVPRTKLPAYIISCYPGLALMAGCFLHRWTSGLEASQLMPRLSLGVLGAVGVGLAVAAPVAARYVMPGEEWLGLIGLVPIAGAAAAFALVRGGRLAGAGVALVVTAFLFNAAMFGFAAPQVSQRQEQERLFSAIRETSAEARVAWYGTLEPSWVFYLDRPIQPLVPKEALGDYEPSPWRTMPMEPGRFFQQGSSCFIITDEKHWEWLRPQLPPDAAVLAECRWFLRKKNLLLIGHESASVAARTSATSERSGR